MRGVILSHTRTVGEKFCTSLAICDGENTFQIRPRLAPNCSTKIASFGLTEAEMVTEWRPGREIEFERFQTIAPAHVRQTHPEDVVWPPQRITLGNALERDVLEGCIAQFTFPSLQDLFPGLKKCKDGKAYVENWMCLRSLGYVRCPQVELTRVSGAVRVIVTDTDDEQYNLALKDARLWNWFTSKNAECIRCDVNVRFALADAITDPTRGQIEDRCYVVVTHILV